MTTKLNTGEVLFEQYLSQWGYDNYEHHPDWLNPPKKPDYLIRTTVGEVVVEVKSFETWGLFENLQEGLIATQSITKTLKPARERISKAARQMKGISGRPLVVVLANPDNRMPLGPTYMMAAMYGDPEFVFPAHRQQPGFWHAGRNGGLHLVNERGVAHGCHAHLSAIAVLRETASSRSEHATEQHVTLDVFETTSNQCVPLPASLFAHPGDRRWGVLGPGLYGRHKTD